MIFNLYNIINHINMSPSNTFILVYYNTIIYNILKILYKECFIQNYSLIYLNNIKYILFEKKFYNRIKVYNKRKLLNYKKYKSLYKLKNTNIFYILQTSKGLLSLNEALQLKIGGKILLEIN